MRACPTCGGATDARFCPHDGAPMGMADAGGDTAAVDADAPMDLPQAWDAPAPRRSRNSHETLFLMQDSGVTLGAAEVVDEEESGSDDDYDSDDYDSDDYDLQGGDDSQHGEAKVGLPYAQPQAPTTVPRSRLAVAAVPMTSTPKPSHRDATHMSGGWGDDLFGAVGKTEQIAIPQPAPLRVVTSEARPHEVPSTPIVAPAQEEADVDRVEPSDRKGRISGLIVLIVVGGTLFFGGRFAWQKVQAPPQRHARAATNLVDIPAPPPPQEATGGLDEVGQENSNGPDDEGRDDEGRDNDGAEERPLLVYETTLGGDDHRSAEGKKLTHAWQVIVRDRDRVHRGHGDTGDSKDSRFASKKGRAELTKLLRMRRLADDVKRAINGGTPRIRVEIWPDQVTVRVLSK